jgi:hypothetical protein
MLIYFLSSITFMYENLAWYLSIQSLVCQTVVVVGFLAALCTKSLHMKQSQEKSAVLIRHLWDLDFCRAGLG